MNAGMAKSSSNMIVPPYRWRSDHADSMPSGNYVDWQLLRHPQRMTPRHAPQHNSQRNIFGLGLTRAAGVVCPSDRALRTTSVPVWRRGSHWIGRRSRPIIPEIRAKKLSGGSAAREDPDTGAPTRSTASRDLFATLGETSRYFNHPKTNKTQSLLQNSHRCANLTVYEDQAGLG